MKKNVGSIDRVVRIILAAILAYLYFSGVVSGTLGIILLVVGILLLLTSLISFCPLYYLLKLRTNK